ncbi:686_t:CDS:2, partial [Paraglomus brasilianum]
MWMELNTFWSGEETTDISWPYSIDSMSETESSKTLKDGKILESLLTWESTSGKQANKIGRTREDSGYITYPSWTIPLTPTIGSTTDWTTTFTTCPMHEELSCSSAISRSVLTTGETSESISGVTTPKNSYQPPSPGGHVDTTMGDNSAPGGPRDIPDDASSTSTRVGGPDDNNNDESEPRGFDSDIESIIVHERPVIHINQLESVSVPGTDGGRNESDDDEYEWRVRAYSPNGSSGRRTTATTSSDGRLSSPFVRELTNGGMPVWSDYDFGYRGKHTEYEYTDDGRMRSMTSTPESLPQISTTSMSNGISEGMKVEGKEE